MVSENERRYDLTYFHPPLNQNDMSLIFWCYDEKKSISELSKLMNIAPKNIILRLPKLEKKGFIIIERMGKGKPTFIISNKNNSEVQELYKTYSFIFGINKILNDDAYKNSPERKAIIDMFEGIKTDKK